MRFKRLQRPAKRVVILCAPLDEKELKTLEDIYEKVKPYLSEEGIKTIEKEGKSVFEKEINEWCTPFNE